MLIFHILRSIFSWRIPVKASRGKHAAVNANVCPCLNVYVYEYTRQCMHMHQCVCVVRNVYKKYCSKHHKTEKIKEKSWTLWYILWRTNNLISTRLSKLLKPCVEKSREKKNYPSRGSRARARGLCMEPASKVVRLLPSHLATSIWSRLLSTQ